MMIKKTTLEKYLAFFNTPILSAGRTIGEMVSAIQAANTPEEHLSIYYDAVSDNIIINWNNERRTIKQFSTADFNQIEARYYQLHALQPVLA